MARRRFTGDTLVIASHNAGKVREIGDLIAPFRVRAISAGELGLPEPEETGLTFIANAELKALAAAQAANLPALADDSGMSVDALDGAPGIYPRAGPARRRISARRCRRSGRPWKRRAPSRPLARSSSARSASPGPMVMSKASRASSR